MGKYQAECSSLAGRPSRAHSADLHLLSLQSSREASWKSHITSLAILVLALASIPAAAYDNGPINGTTDAWTINFGYIVSDTFTGAVNGFRFGAWEFPGDTMTSVDWSITSGENGGTVYGSGTASGASLTDRFISTNQYGYNIDDITVSGLVVGTTNGVTYWLNLQNAAVPSGDPVYWDENSGAGCAGTGCPSKASESAVGTIPSEAFSIASSCCGVTPEPASIVLFGSGVLALAGMLRRRLNL
jgi:hypothetical protein